MIDYIRNLEFAVFLFASLANFALALIVLQFAERNRVRYFFFLFGLAQLVWIITNYYAFRVSADYFLLFARLTMATAAIHAYAFFLFIKSYLAISKLNRLTLISSSIGVIAIVGLCMSPFVFSRLELNEVTGVLTPITGPAVIIFGVFVGLCIVGALIPLIKSYRLSTGLIHSQLRLFTTGLSLTFIFVLGFSFLTFIISGDLSTVRFGHLYTLPFIAFTAYAMVRHRFMNVKVIVAELAVILLDFVMVFSFLTSENTNQYIISGVTLTGTIILGALMVRSVMQEVEQKEILQKLTVDLEEANKKLTELDKIKSQYLSFASHQVKAPMTAVKGFATLIFDGTYGPASEKIKEAAIKIKNSADRMIMLVNNILNVRKIEEGKMEYNLLKEDVAKLLNDVVEELRPLAVSKNLEFSLKSDKSSHNANIDIQYFRQVLQNLVENAIKYTEVGFVKVELDRDGTNSLVITVTDSGRGIPADVLPKLFEEYSRQASMAQSVDGTGLGLFIAKRIITAHKGEIWASSNGEGEGSTFGVKIPAI